MRIKVEKTFPGELKNLQAPAGIVAEASPAAFAYRFGMHVA
jgi:hypothetical protein